MLTTLATETIYKSLSPTGRFKLCSSFITVKDDRPVGNIVATTHGVPRLRTQCQNDEGRRERARTAINNTVIINANANCCLNYQVNTVE